MCMSVRDYRECEPGSESTLQLERFFGRELGVAPEQLSTPGIHLLASPRREAESWCGYQLPVIYVERRGSAVLSVSARLLPEARWLLEQRAEGVQAARELLTLAASLYRSAKLLDGHGLYCEPEGFQPQRTVPIEKLLPHAPEWELMREHFDGPIFVTRGPDGEVASWAAVKLKDEHVWEIAVTTEEGYRGRGLAKAVVSAATEYILDCGRVPLYVHNGTNIASGRVARALGYQRFARELYCSVSEDNQTGMW